MMWRDELLSELYKQMFMVAYAKVKNKSDALDIVQESWVKILDKIDTLKDADKLFQWAKVIASNTAINLIKKRNTMSQITTLNECFSHNKIIEESGLEERMMMEEMYDELKKFDPQTRRIFLYKFTYGWKDQQIADELSLPIGTVKARIHRGKEKLRDILRG